MKELKKIGYEVDKWYMVQIAYGFFVPAKFISLQNPCPLPHTLDEFPHPGKAIFENVEYVAWSCGFKGTLDPKSKTYTGSVSCFRPVTENELWAVQAIE